VSSTPAGTSTPPYPHPTRILTMIDLATTELRAGNHSETCRHAITAAANLRFRSNGQ